MTFTIVARGQANRGHRYLLKARDLDEATREAKRICRREGVELVTIFTGHMAALVTCMSRREAKRLTALFGVAVAQENKRRRIIKRKDDLALDRQLRRNRKEPVEVFVPRLAAVE